MDGPGIARSVTRIAYELLERQSNITDLVVLGIPTRGVVLGRRLVDTVESISGSEIESGILDIAPFRDDLPNRPSFTEVVLDVDPEVEGRTVVLIDDVLYTGRTIRAAFDALTALGRVTAVYLAVLVDRGHREFPIRADFVGKNLPTSSYERVSVQLIETDGRDGVWIEGTGNHSSRNAVAGSEMAG